jgi:hypothetical protein
MGKYDPWGDKEKQIQFTKPTEGSSTRRAVGYGRKKPAPKKQGPEELAAIKKMRERPAKPRPKPRPTPPNPNAFSPQGRAGREMPKQIMGSTKAQRADSARELMDNMRSRNLLRSRKKKGM